MGLRRTGRDAAGFTLGELLVVITILGVLGAIVVLATGGFVDESTAAACATERRQIAWAQERHRLETGAYGDEDELVTGNFLRRPSSYYDVTSTGDDYTLVPTEAVAVRERGCFAPVGHADLA